MLQRSARERLAFDIRQQRIHPLHVRRSSLLLLRRAATAANHRHRHPLLPPPRLPLVPRPVPRRAPPFPLLESRSLPLHRMNNRFGRERRLWRGAGEGEPPAAERVRRTVQVQAAGAEAKVFDQRLQFGRFQVRVWVRVRRGGVDSAIEKKKKKRGQRVSLDVCSAGQTRYGFKKSEEAHLARPPPR